MWKAKEFGMRDSKSEGSGNFTDGYPTIGSASIERLMWDWYRHRVLAWQDPIFGTKLARGNYRCRVCEQLFTVRQQEGLIKISWNGYDDGNYLLIGSLTLFQCDVLRFEEMSGVDGWHYRSNKPFRLSNVCARLRTML